MKALHVLIVEDSEEDAKVLLRQLRRGGYEPIFERVETVEVMLTALNNQKWDLILADYVMPEFDGLSALKVVHDSGLDIPFIIVSGSIGEEIAVAAMKAGAHDYLMKDNLSRLVPAVKRELVEAEIRRERREALQRAQLYEETQQRLFQEVSTARDRLRSLTQRLVEMQETERRHLAQELHDQVGQNLTGLAINLSFLRDEVIGTSREEVTTRLQDCFQLVNETIRRINDVMGELRPTILDDLGLRAALKGYAKRFSSRTGITVAVHGDEFIPRLTPDVETALFRIAQEALTNIAKHASAAQVSLTLDTFEHIDRLTIDDDGVGFNPTEQRQPDERRGLGLMGMQERMMAVGGKLQVESTPGQGTRIIAEVPRLSGPTMSP